MEHGVDDADSRIWRHWILRILIIDDHNAVDAAAADVAATAYSRIWRHWILRILIIDHDNAVDAASAADVAASATAAADMF